ncbi:MAG: hypothetical protein K1X57_16350 [Gemmataceae bacterium]|nr:hypothetical protein [Gemmataceae bacterium]
MRGSSLAWPASLDLLRPFIVTYWSGRTTDDMPADVRAVVDAAGMTHQHLNLALFALDADGKLLRSTIPFVRPPAFRFDPAAQGKDFAQQLTKMLDGLDLPKPAERKAKLALPDVPTGLRIYLTFGANRLNHYRTPTVEALELPDSFRAALRYPDEARDVAGESLRPMLQQFYPPAIMDGHGGCRKIDARLKLSPAGSDGERRWAILRGTVAIELDNKNGTRYEGPLTLAVSYPKDGSTPKSIRGTGTWEFPKHTPEGRVAETIVMTAAIESRPE